LLDGSDQRFREILEMKAMAKTQTQQWRDQVGMFLFAFAFVAIAVTCLSIYWTQSATGTEAQSGEGLRSLAEAAWRWLGSAF